MAEDKGKPEDASNIFNSTIDASFTPRPNDDFVAEIKYKSTEDGGRRGFVLSGYRAQVKFPFTDMQTSGQQKFHGKEKLYPGETITATIKIVSPQFFINALHEGMEFEIREGAKIMAIGRLIKILNPTLIKS